MKKETILFFETDDSCALCNVKNRQNLSIHHIDGDKKNNKYDNLIVLCHNCHHRITNDKNINQSEINEVKRNLIYRTLTIYGVNALKLANRKKEDIAAIPFLVAHLVEMGYMKKTGEIMSCEDVDYLATYSITEEGRFFYKKWLK